MGPVILEQFVCVLAKECGWQCEKKEALLLTAF